MKILLFLPSLVILLMFIEGLNSSSPNKREIVAYIEGDGGSPVVMGDPGLPGPLNGWGYYNAFNHPKALGIPDQWKKGLIINKGNKAPISVTMITITMMMVIDLVLIY